MGVLVPEDQSLAGLANDAERRVVEAFRDGLDDGWLVLPNVELRTPQRDHELDVVLIHQSFGVLDIEVKGHRVEVRRGEWFHGDRPMRPQPLAQARKNAYALREVIRTLPGLERIEVEYGVALPNTVGYEGRLPPEADPVQILTEPRLGDVTDAVEMLAVARHSSVVLDADDITAIVDLLRPDIDFSWEASARLRASRTRLDELCTLQTQALERLDANRRVVALGAAGTGKTRLAMAWARRAYARDERVLLTCYNEPLADRMADRLPDDDGFRIGPFLRMALGLDGMAPLEVPDDADHAWWTITAVGHLVSNWHGVTERFDTIVVDEAQDFSPAWLAMLESLLDPEGARRMLLAADPAQELYVRGFVVPAAEDGWVRCELVNNCRNAHEIGTLLRRRLHGAPAPSLGPVAVDLRYVTIGADDVEVTTRDEVDRLLLEEERDPGQIMVLTFTSSLRDRLATAVELVRWEDRETGVIGENVHRVKGLEADTVVLVTDTDDITDDLLYVGISRAVSELVIIGPAALGTRLGLR